MDMGILTAPNDVWLQFSDRQRLETPPADWPNYGISAQARAPAANLPQRLPMLNWPTTLFEDVRLHL